MKIKVWQAMNSNRWNFRVEADNIDEALDKAKSCSPALEILAIKYLADLELDHVELK